MRRYFIIPIISMLFGLGACSKDKIENSDMFSFLFTPPKVGVEYTDSVSLDSFLYKNEKKVGVYKKEISNFYKKRDYKLAWSNKGKFIPQAGSLVNMIEDAPSHGVNPLADAYLHTEFNHLTSLKRPSKKDARVKRKEMDMLLTSLYFAYADQVWNGKIDHEKSGWFIERKKFKEEKALEQVLNLNILPNDSSTTLNMSDISPLNSEYDKMKDVLDHYLLIKHNGGWPRINYTGKRALKKGDNTNEIINLKKRLFMSNDFKGDKYDSYFGNDLTAALKSFQKRHGLKQTGMMTKSTVEALNVSVDERIEQLKINMERWKWMPESMPENYIWINIPEYKLYAYENKKLQWDMNVIVGKHGNETSTPIFNNEIKYIVFNPTWRVPDNIVKKEILPIIQRNVDYLTTNSIDVLQGQDTIDPYTVDWSTMTEDDVVKYIFKQRPKDSNPLGKIKFAFPNNYDIYLHDTPTKYLFENSKRSYSHGCIRVEDPMKLAKYLLKDDPTWTDSEIQSTLYTNQETIVNVAKKEPIFIVYFTSWIDKDGNINFRDDLYQHDKSMKMEFQSMNKKEN